MSVNSLQGKDRRERNQHDHDGIKHRSTNRLTCGNHGILHITADWLIAKLNSQPVHHVFGQHDRRIDKHTDRNHDSGQRHDIRLDINNSDRAQEAHRKERSEHTQRQRDGNHQPSSKMLQHQQDAHCGNQERLNQSPRHSRHRAGDQ